jgi:short-subunit dehydrogenase
MKINPLKLNPLMNVGMGFAGVASSLTAVARQFRKTSFKKKVVLIMGGSRGLALEMARVLAKEGAILALAARDSDELQRARLNLGLKSDRIFTFVCDVTEHEQVKATIAAVQQSCGQIDILINNAGLIEVGPMEVQTIKDYDDSMKTHFWGPLYATEAVLPSMRRRRAGRIVNIASVAGLISVPHLLPYCASKHALVGYSNGLRSELLKDNIFVTTVCPGLMRTGSPIHADMKGKNKLEYALFSILDSLPFTSIDASEAAKQVVEACRHGDASLVITSQAQIAALAHAIAPDFVRDFLGVTNFFLPRKGGIGKASARGSINESSLSPSILTKMSDDAALRNNELG